MLKIVLIIRILQGKYGRKNVFQSVVTYECNKGYTFSEDSLPLRTCQANGKYTGKTKLKLYLIKIFKISFLYRYTG